jgi:hypothetical protein
MIEGKYTIELKQTGCYHFLAWLEEDGERVGYGTTGCSIATHRFNRNRKGCEKLARKACAKLRREYERRKAAGEPQTVTVTFDGQPSYADLQARIAELERELEIA